MTRRGFTLIELLVVIAMIAILAGAMTTSVSGARARAKISRAETESREMTNAILAYANYTDDGSLSSVVMNNTPASRSSLAFILGEGSRGGSKVPVLYNAAMRSDGRILDPWGKPYRVTVKSGDTVSPAPVNGLQTGLFFPNWHRLKEDER